MPTVAPTPLPPSQPTTFIGRHAELADMARLLADPDCRLVTLVGPGGAGKTRLAIEVAARHREVFADGIALIPLQAVPTMADLPAAIAAGGGVPPAGPQDRGVRRRQAP